MASPTQWTWVWVSSGSWWWTGKPGMLQSMGSQRVGHDWATELNSPIRENCCEERSLRSQCAHAECWQVRERERDVSGSGQLTDRTVWRAFLEEEKKPGQGWGLFQMDVSGIQGLKCGGKEDGRNHRRDAAWMRGSDLFRTFRGYGEMEMEADGHQREKKGEPSPGTGRGGRKVQPPEEPWPWADPVSAYLEEPWGGLRSKILLTFDSQFCKPKWQDCMNILFILVLCIYSLAELGLHCCLWAFLQLWWGGATLWLCCTGFSLWWLLLLQSTGSRHMDSGVVVHGLSCSTACGVFLNQGSNLCLCIARQILNHWTTMEAPGSQELRENVNWVQERSWWGHRRRQVLRSWVLSFQDPKWWYVTDSWLWLL